jgi:hypothetical protein
VVKKKERNEETEKKRKERKEQRKKRTERTKKKAKRRPLFSTPVFQRVFFGSAPRRRVHSLQLKPTSLPHRFDYIRDSNNRWY